MAPARREETPQVDHVPWGDELVRPRDLLFELAEIKGHLAHIATLASGDPGKLSAGMARAIGKLADVVEDLSKRVGEMGSLEKMLPKTLAVMGRDPDVRRNDKMRFDYDTRTDDKPVYIGVAPPGTAESIAIWKVSKLEYDASHRVIRQDPKTGVTWDQRASLNWGF